MAEPFVPTSTFDTKQQDAIKAVTEPIQAAIVPATLVLTLLPYIYPVGCLYFSTDGTNPATTLGFGTWAAYGAGRVPVGFLAADPDFGTDGATGGAKTHTLTTAELATHSHPHNHNPIPGTGQFRVTAGGGNNIGTVAGSNNALSATTDTDATTAGSDVAHNNLQPFVVVRIWRRNA